MAEEPKKWMSSKNEIRYKVFNHSKTIGLDLKVLGTSSMQPTNVIEVPLLFDDGIDTSEPRTNGTLTLSYDEFLLAGSIINAESDPNEIIEVNAVVSLSFEQLVMKRKCYFPALALRDWREELIEVQKEKLPVCYLYDTDNSVTLSCSAVGNNGIAIGGEIELGDYLNPVLLHPTPKQFGSCDIKTPGVFCSGVRVLFGNGLADEEATSKLIHGLAQWLVAIGV